MAITSRILRGYMSEEQPRRVWCCGNRVTVERHVWRECQHETRERARECAREHPDGHVWLAKGE